MQQVQSCDVDSLSMNDRVDIVGNIAYFYRKKVYRIMLELLAVSKSVTIPLLIKELRINGFFDEYWCIYKYVQRLKRSNIIREVETSKRDQSYGQRLLLLQSTLPDLLNILNTIRNLGAKKHV